MESIEEIREKILDFLDLENVTKIAIVADNDEDGITSAINMSKFLEGEKEKEIRAYFFDRHLAKEKFAENFREFAPDKTIFLDLGGDFVEEALESISDFTKEILVIDHHKPIEKYENAKFSVLNITPLVFSKIEPSKYAVSKIVYDLFGGVDWLAAVGVIGDSSADQWKDFVNSVQQKYSVSFEKLSEIVSVIVTIRTKHRGMRDELFDFLKATDSPNKIFDTDFYKLKLEFDEKLEEVREDYEKNAEKHPEFDLVFYFAKDDIINPIINPLAKQKKNTTLVFYKKLGNLVNVSMRRADFKVNLPEMIKFAIGEEPNASGGGHIPASGASFPEPYLETFKERIIMYLKENYSKE